MKKSFFTKRNRILISFVMAVTVFVIITGVYYIGLWRNVRDELFSSLKRDTAVILQRFGEVNEQIIQSAKTAGYTTALQKALFSDDPGEKVLNIPTSRELIASAKDQDRYITDLFYYADGGHLYTYSEYTYAFLANMKRYDFDRQIGLSEAFLSEYVLEDNGVDFFFLYVPIYRTATGIAHRSKENGICAVLCNYSDILPEAASMLGNSYASYLLYDGKVISSNLPIEALDEETLALFAEGEKKYIVDEKTYYSYTVDNGLWKIICVAPTRLKIMQRLFEDRFLYLDVILSIAFFAFLLILFGKQDSERREAEVQRELLSATIAQQQAEMSAYRSQINPHFFFNTLECVRSMAQYYNVEEIEDMVSAMSKMFRYSLYSEMTVDFEREIDMLEQYFKITLYRFPDGYELVRNIDENTLNYRVPSMILQPLVENAIKHAFADSGDGVRNTITVLANINDEGLLRVSVKDNGKGMSAERLTELIRENTDGSSITKAKDSIGIKNIYERIKLFDKENTMEFFSKEGEYMEVVLTLHPAGIIQ